MMEFPHIIRDTLVNGLTPNWPPPIDSPYLTALENARPLRDGACSLERIATPLLPEVAHPFPQLIRGELTTLLCDEQTVSTISPEWVATEVSMYRPEEQGDLVTPLAGGIWHHASFNAIWFLTNGASLVCSVPSAYQGRVLCSNTLGVQTLCAHRNRLVLAGLRGDWFDGPEWARVLDAWRDTGTMNSIGFRNMAFDANWVVYGERGGGSSAVPFHVLLTALGYFGSDEFANMEEVITDYIERGELGMCPVPFPGTIRAALPFGDSVRIYGSEGICTLVQQDNRYVPGGFLKPGIPGRGCVDGDDLQHVWVRTDGQLDSEPPDKKFRDQSYSHWIAPMIEPLRSRINTLENTYSLAGYTDVHTCYADGNLWFAAKTGATTSAFGLFSRDGTHVVHALPSKTVPYGIAVGNGRVFIVDYHQVGNVVTSRVLVYSIAGTALTSFGVPGDEHGEFSAPTGALWHDNELYICDGGNHRIEVYNADGVYGRTFTSTGIGGPIAICEHGGVIYTLWRLSTPSVEHRILKFEPDGTLISATVITASTGELDIAVTDHEVYVSDASTGGGQIVVYSSVLAQLRTITLADVYSVEQVRNGIWASTYDTPVVLNEYSIDFEDPPVTDQEIYEEFALAWGTVGSASGEYSDPRGVCVLGNYVYIGDSLNDRMVITDKAGIVKQIVTSLSGATKIVTWGANVVVCVRDAKTVQVRSAYPASALVRTIDCAALTALGGICVAGDSVFVCDRLGAKVYEYDLTDGTLVTSWGTFGSGDGELYQPQSIEHYDGELYVTDYALNRVTVFDLTGVYARQWGEIGADPGQFSYPFGIAASATGEIYVTDGNNHVQVFDADGVYLRQFGTAGDGDGEFNGVRGLGIDGADIYVCDGFGGRIEKFTRIVGPEQSTYEFTTNLIVMFDQGTREWWVCDGETCYVLTAAGLGGPNDILPTSIVRDGDKGLVGILPDAEPWLVSTRVRTVQSCLGDKGHKRMSALVAYQEGLRDMDVCLLWRNDTTQEFHEVQTLQANQAGIVFPNVNMVDGQIEITGEYETENGFTMAALEARLDLIDRRHVRGPRIPAKES